MPQSSTGDEKLREVEIYTDGGCINNPGPGGYGVVILDTDSRILWLNAAAERLLGLSTLRDVGQFLPYLLRHSRFTRWLQEEGRQAEVIPTVFRGEKDDAGAESES